MIEMHNIYPCIYIYTRFVFDALRMPLGTNMVWFGLLALDRFRDRLREYPKFCKEVFKTPWQWNYDF